MILSNTSIFEALDDQRLKIDPEPAPRRNTPTGPKSPFDRSAVDLHLAPYYSVPRDAPNVDIDISRPGVIATLEALTDQHSIPAEGYLLQPNEFILSQTIEIVHLRLPEDIPKEAAGKPLLAA